eukprot:2403502-Rhodomonas_salina.2
MEASLTIFNEPSCRRGESDVARRRLSGPACCGSAEPQQAGEEEEREAEQQRQTSPALTRRVTQRPGTAP